LYVDRLLNLSRILENQTENKECSHEKKPLKITRFITDSP
jgi:hypothetical protein